MTFYHGSPVGGLNELKPFLSEHKKQYVYFTQNPVVALLYAVHSVDKPFSYYPYGFDKDDLKQTIQKHNLKQLPDNSMSRFIREHFPEVWEKE